MNVVYKPDWFRNDKIFVSYAETVGINKDGFDLYVIDPATGSRTGEIDDRASKDVDALLDGSEGETSRWVDGKEFSVAVPTYYDLRYNEALGELLSVPGFDSFEAKTIGDLLDGGELTRRAGHGSPSADLRNSTVPYIKVSDIRAGQVNINPSNLVSEAVAERFWKGSDSGLRAFDLITPIRSSKNIGEFAVLMPGQERVVLTKEMLVLRTSDDAPADNFFLLWALSLKVVRDQWRRVVFMQTNREDVGSRFLEIEIPWPTDVEVGNAVSQDFRDYYLGVEKLRTKFITELESKDLHHVFLGRPFEPSDDEADATAEGIEP